MQTSETTGELGAALAKAQGAITAAVKDATNPHLKNKYADLASVWDACRKPLTDNGLGILQGVFTEHDNGGGWIVKCTTRLQHASGEWIEDVLTLPAPGQKGITPAQSIGIAATYARRYGLSAMVGITQEDTDGGKPDGPPAVDTEKIYNEGAAAGRQFVVREWLAKGSGDFSAGSFAATLKKADLDPTVTLENVKLWRLWRGGPKPSRMKTERIQPMITFLASDEGRKSWAEFSEACGPLKAPRKAKAKAEKEKPTPAGNPSWTREAAEAFDRRLKELDFGMDEVGGYLVAHNKPHPSAMDAETRKKTLDWLADKGATLVCDWTIEQAKKETE